MTKPAKQPQLQSKPNFPQPSQSESTPEQPPTASVDIAKEIIQKIDGLSTTLKMYPIRDLVNHAKKFGPYLKNKGLETNQVRKFLDAINRLKSVLAQENDFSKIETEVVLLKPKLAYAAARKPAAKPLSDVMSKAIDKVESTEDFERLVQFIESIIAYHKAEGGK